MTPESYLTQYEQALASQDWSQVAPLIHDDCTVTFSNGTTHRGKEAVRKAFERNFELIEDEEYAISEVHWAAREANFAVVTYVYDWSGLIQGEKASGSGRGTSTLKGNGDIWLLISEHLGPKS
ncbi:MAG: nuclear transport factor 2 family protein [Verrucomicrobiota bacterium]